MTEISNNSAELVRSTPRAATTRAFLTAAPGGPAQRLAGSKDAVHPVRAYVMGMVAAYVVFSAILTGIGMLVVHVLEHGYVGRWDHHVSQWFVVHRTTTWNRVSGVFTLMADTFTVAGITVLVTIVLAVRRWGRRVWLFATGLAVELSVFLTVNTIVARPRPLVPHVGGTPSTFSFPSGHTAATVALYGGLAVIVTTVTRRALARVVAWTLTLLLTIAVALSRVYRGEHYPTDVIAGALLGVGALATAVFMIRVLSVDRTTALERGDQTSLDGRARELKSEIS